MANLKTKVDLYLKDNSKNWEAEKDNLILQNDGSGDYIHTWNVSGVSKPTDEQLASYETAGNAAETLSGILNKREREYPSIVDQLDDIYHNGIDAWKARIKSIKDANPKS